MSSRTLPGSFRALRDSLVEEALHDLEAVSARELIRSARALEARYEQDAAGMFRFAGVFRDVACSRRRGEDRWLARHQLRAAIFLADESVADRLADAPEPFWRHVRDALRAHQAWIQG